MNDDLQNVKDILNISFFEVDRRLEAIEKDIKNLSQVGSYLAAHVEAIEDLRKAVRAIAIIISEVMVDIDTTGRLKEKIKSKIDDFERSS